MGSSRNGFNVLVYSLQNEDDSKIYNRGDMVDNINSQLALNCIFLLINNSQPNRVTLHQQETAST